MGIEKYDELARLVNEARMQFEEFKGGKKIAATRARKLLQQIKKVAQECRIEIQEVKKGQPGESGAEKPPSA
jgi:hypothetical protein